MRNIFFFLLTVLSLSAHGQEIAVKKSIEIFFEGFHTRDTIKVKSVCHENMILQSIAESATSVKLTEEKVALFYKAVASFPLQLKFQEKILEYKIHIEGSIAHAWTPYEFLINDKVVHVGVNSFTLLLENNQWKIVHIIDTRRKK